MATEAPTLRIRYAMLPEVAATSPYRHTFPHRLNVTTLTAGSLADAATGTPASTDSTATRVARARRLRMPSRSAAPGAPDRQCRSQLRCFGCWDARGKGQDESTRATVRPMIVPVTARPTPNRRVSGSHRLPPATSTKSGTHPQYDPSPGITSDGPIRATHGPRQPTAAPAISPAVSPRSTR